MSDRKGGANLLRKKKKKGEIVNFPEPKRKSLYDVLCDNMRFYGRLMFVHRIIYIGDHSFPATEENISFHFRQVVNYVNSFYCEEYLTGFLVYYPTYFCHVVEGSEEAIRKHLYLLLNKPETSKHLHRLKLLVAYHHINQRMLHCWTEMSAKPPHLLERIDPTIDHHGATVKVMHCIHQLYRLGIALRSVNKSPAEDIDAAKVLESVHDIDDAITNRCGLSKIACTVSTYDIIGRPTDTLPENQLLEYLLECRYTEDVRVYAMTYGVIPTVITYRELAKPVVTDYVPKNVFDTIYDPITDLSSATAAHE